MYPANTLSTYTAYHPRRGEATSTRVPGAIVPIAGESVSRVARMLPHTVTYRTAAVGGGRSDSGVVGVLGGAGGRVRVVSNLVVPAGTVVRGVVSRGGTSGRGGRLMTAAPGRSRDSAWINTAATAASATAKAATTDHVIRRTLRRNRTAYPQYSHVIESSRIIF